MTTRPFDRLAKLEALEEHLGRPTIRIACAILNLPDPGPKPRHVDGPAAFAVVGALATADPAQVRVRGEHNEALRFLCALAPAYLTPDKLPWWVAHTIDNPKLSPYACSDPEHHTNRECSSLVCALHIGGSYTMGGDVVHQVGLGIRRGETQTEIVERLGLSSRNVVSRISQYVKATLAYAEAHRGEVCA